MTGDFETCQTAMQACLDALSDKDKDGGMSVGIASPSSKPVQIECFTTTELDSCKAMVVRARRLHPEHYAAQSRALHAVRAAKRWPRSACRSVKRRAWRCAKRWKRSAPACLTSTSASRIRRSPTRRSPTRCPTRGAADHDCRLRRSATCNSTAAIAARGAALGRVVHLRQRADDATTPATASRVA